MKKIIFFFSFFIVFHGFSQSEKAFQIYTKKGKKISVKKILKNLEKGDIILFGELHNNPISHWLELKSAKHLHKKKENLLLGAEMIESDQQDFLNQYLSDSISQDELNEAIKLWINYKTDYKPLIDFAKENNLPFIGTNIPRRYASMVYKKGMEVLEAELPEDEKKFVAPLPINYDPELPGYKAMLKMMGHQPNPNFPKSQAIKDATMAFFIYTHFSKEKTTFLHFNGAYHSNNFEGIFWYLNLYDENLNVLTVSTIEQENCGKFDKNQKNLADFILVVDEDMTKTY